MRLRINLDEWGACASALCAAHCLVFPLLAVFAPLAMATTSTTPDCCAETQTGWMSAFITRSDDCCDDPSAFWVHAGMLCVTFPLAGLALVSGFTRHRRRTGLILGGAGLACQTGVLLASDLLSVPGAHLSFNVIGCALLMGAHLWNRSQCSCCAKYFDATGFPQPAEEPA